MNYKKIARIFSGALFLSFLIFILSMGQISFADSLQPDTGTIKQIDTSFSGMANTDQKGTTGAQLQTAVNSQTGSSSGCVKPTEFGSLFAFAKCLLTDYVIPFLFALAVVIFLVGVMKYVAGGDNEEKRTQGRDIMWFGIVALFVMVGVWGFVKILAVTFGFDYGLPNLPPKSTSVFGTN